MDAKPLTLFEMKNRKVFMLFTKAINLLKKNLKPKKVNEKW